MNKAISVLISFFLLNSLCAQVEEQIEFLSDTFLLSGTISKPIGSQSKWPVVVFVHGSGPNDRNQTTFVTGGNAMCLYPGLVDDTIRNFLDISDFLVANGYATFRFDKRSFTYGTSIDQTQITVHDFISDVHNAVDFIKGRNDIDSNCISLLGHSQGGTFVPVIAKQRTDISKLIALATPSTPIDTLISGQLRDLYYTCLNDTINGDMIYNQSLGVYSQIRNGTWPLNQPINGAYPKFWKSWIDISDSILLNFNEANIPTMFSFGMNDFNVPSSDSQIFQSGLLNEFQISHFQNLNHFLTDSNSAVVKNELLAEILNWLTVNQCDTETSLNNYTLSYTVKDYEDYLELEIPSVGSKSVKVHNIMGSIVQEFDTDENLVRLYKYSNSGIHFIELSDGDLTSTVLKVLY